MFKRAIYTFLEFVLFCGLLFVGGYWAVVRLAMELRAMQNQWIPPMIPLWKVHVNPHLDYVVNGVVFATGLLVLILLVQAIRKRTRLNSPWTVLVFVIALLLSLAFKSGFVPLTPGS